MKVALVVPPIRMLELGAPNDFEDLGLGCIAAYLRQHGHQVTILDCQLQSMETDEAIQKLTDLQADVIGLSISFQNTETKGGMELINAIRQAGLKQPLIAGGVAATFLHEFLLKQCPGLDIICLGEGEETMLDLVQRLERGQDWHDMPGIAYRNNDSAIRTSPRPPVDLAKMPFAARDLLPVQLDRAVAQMAPCRFGDYDAEMVRMIRQYGSDPSAADIESSRGCPYKCAFCAVSSFYNHNPGTRWRTRGVDSVLDEMAMLEKEWGVKAVSFNDDNFVGPGKSGRERALTFARENLRRGLSVKYNFWCRADTVEEDLFRRLKDTGLYHVHLGIETGSQTVLDRYKKGITVRDNQRALEILTKLGIPATASLILFDPYTTLDELSETIRFCLESGAIHMLANPTGINVLVPFVGTPMRETILQDVELAAVTKDADFADASLYWQYQCLDADTELVRQVFYAINYMIQKRIRSWLRLRGKVHEAMERLDQALHLKPEDRGDSQALLAELEHESVDKWQPWYDNIVHFLWTSYAEVVEIMANSHSSLVAEQTRPLNWRTWFKDAMTEYDRRYLDREFEREYIHLNLQTARALELRKK